MSRITAIILSIMMVFALIPQMSLTAHADTGDLKRTIMLGTDILGKYANQSDRQAIYMSPYLPVWTVIGYNGYGVASEEGTMTLLDDSPHATRYYSPFRTDYQAADADHYSKSDLKYRIEHVVAEDALPAGVREAIVPRTLASGEYAEAETDCVAGEPVENALLWPLSTKEAFALNQDIRGNDEAWWLRSPGMETSQYKWVALVDYVRPGYSPSEAGRVVYTGTETRKDFWVRSAFHINLDSVLFTSAATVAGGGKSNAVGPSLTEITPYVGNIWKLTIKDS